MLESNKKQKKFYIAQEDIKRFIESNEGCIATDRITVDGCKVGFMYREEPYKEEYPDSGWRFMAGDEDDEYMNNPDNHSIYQLNTICNYDPEIIPFLESLPGTAYIRNESGEFVIDSKLEIQEDLLN